MKAATRKDFKRAEVSAFDNYGRDFSRNYYGLDVGIVRLHEIDDEWVTKQPPLWRGSGKGIFSGMKAPQTAKEFVGCIMRLFVELLLKEKCPDGEESYSSRAKVFYKVLQTEDGASFSDLQDKFLCRSISGWTWFLSTLLYYSLPEDVRKRNKNTVTRTRSFWMFRLIEPVRRAWHEWRELPDFRMHWKGEDGDLGDEDDELAEEQCSSDSDDGGMSDD
jgi:hypothetical protein